MKATLNELQSWLSGARIEGNGSHAASPNAGFDGVSTDSRSVAAGNVFVALRGDHFDAHDFLQEVAAKKVAAVVVQQAPAGLSVPAIVVPDTRVALAEMGRAWRRRFAVPVIGVTGSNGKTTVKEMIASILASAYDEAHILATRGNLNNDIGVPLTVMRLDAPHRAAVIELGMNHPGEIALLASIAQPLVGLVNNAQREHLEFMENVEAVARENGAVIQSLPQDGVAVFPSEDTYAPLWREFAAGRKTITFGLDATADVRGSYIAHQFGSKLDIQAQGKRFSITLAAAGEHNVRNALAAAACALAVGVDTRHIVQGLEAFAPVKGRLQRKSAADGITVIDDTYNANPDSMRAAIDVLAQSGGRKLLVLGDMGEVGDQGQQFHQEIGDYAHARGIDELFALGELARYSASAFGRQDRHCMDLESLLAAVGASLQPNDTVLVKGSRFMKMERVVQHLVASDNNVLNNKETH